MNLERGGNGMVPLVLFVDLYFSIMKAGKIWWKTVFWLGKAYKFLCYSSSEINCKCTCSVEVRQEKATWTSKQLCVGSWGSLLRLSQKWNIWSSVGSDQAPWALAAVAEAGREAPLPGPVPQPIASPTCTFLMQHKHFQAFRLLYEALNTYITSKFICT